MDEIQAFNVWLDVQTGRGDAVGKLARWAVNQAIPLGYGPDRKAWVEWAWTEELKEAAKDAIKEYREDERKRLERAREEAERASRDAGEGGAGAGGDGAEG
ncbi:MAG TPA: hypothetical protein VD948_13035 [Rhodothermales bacterium]|nr:hypothetical protein [Rhodothermales bacterium]